MIDSKMKIYSPHVEGSSSDPSGHIGIPLHLDLCNKQTTPGTFGQDISSSLHSTDKRNILKQASVACKHDSKYQHSSKQLIFVETNVKPVGKKGLFDFFFPMVSFTFR